MNNLKYVAKEQYNSAFCENVTVILMYNLNVLQPLYYTIKCENKFW